MYIFINYIYYYFVDIIEDFIGPIELTSKLFFQNNLTFVM